MGDIEPVSVRVLSGLDDVAAAEWDACACPGGRDGTSTVAYNPFVSHAFLKTLEDADCLGAEAGWLPRHLVAGDGAGGIAAVAPCYLKSHSQGEYVFDHGWADAYERAGGRYYPKLQISVPFSPVPGRRLMVRPDLDETRLRAVLAEAAAQIVRRNGLSSAHVTFLSEAEWELLGAAGWLRRTDRQFHWLNDGYTGFDGFLASLNARRRKQVRRERRDARAGGIEIEWITGTDIDEAHWDVFFEFYLDTSSRKWGQPYLNRTFFSLLGERMADDILLVMARRDGRPIAGALNMIGSDTLFGRYWGTVDEQPFLHFEVCYYQAIEYAISHGLQRVEAGAQGAHKLARGYIPTTTHSAHWIGHPGLRRAIEDYLERERRQVELEGEALLRHAPFRKA